MTLSRRQFLKQLSLLAAASACLPTLTYFTQKELFFDISLAEWSLHRALRKGEFTNLDFPALAQKEFGIAIIEFVNQFFKDKATDTAYLKDLLTRCKDNGVRNHLIMIDGEGNLGDPDHTRRNQAVQNHYKWVDAATILGCQTIRVNAYGEGTAEDVGKAAVEGLGKLSEFAAQTGINIVVENHGSYSSNGAWLADVIKKVNRKNCGTLPDFGNFCIKQKQGGCEQEYDRYQGVKEMMPFAKGVSAKTHDFEPDGNDTQVDFRKMMKIVKDSSFRGIVGIEYEGSTLSEFEGIKKTKALLEQIGRTI